MKIIYKGAIVNLSGDLMKDVAFGSYIIVHKSGDRRTTIYSGNRMDNRDKIFDAIVAAVKKDVSYVDIEEEQTILGIGVE